MKPGTIVVVAGLFLAVFSFLPAHAANQAIGTVEFIKSRAFGTLPGGQKKSKFPGDDFFSREILETLCECAVRVRFRDGSVLALEEASHFQTEYYDYASAGGKPIQVLKMAEGVFRFISGNMPRQAIVLKTPTAVIKVRGTAIDVTVANDGATNVHVLQGMAYVTANKSEASRLIETGNGVAVKGGGWGINRVPNSQPATDPGPLSDSPWSGAGSKAAPCKPLLPREDWLFHVAADTTDGTKDGTRDGTKDGTYDGTRDGTYDGTRDGTYDGTRDGTYDGTRDGTDDGTRDGTYDGTRDGTRDGTYDGTDGIVGDGIVGDGIVGDGIVNVPTVTITPVDGGGGGETTITVPPADGGDDRDQAAPTSTPAPTSAPTSTPSTSSDPTPHPAPTAGPTPHPEPRNLVPDVPTPNVPTPRVTTPNVPTPRATTPNVRTR